MTTKGHSAKASGDSAQYFDRLRAIQRSYQSVIYLMEKEDWEAAVVVADRVMARLDSAIDDIKAENEYNRAYMDVVIQNHLTHFNEDKRKLNAIAKGEELPSKFDETEFLDILKRVDHSLRVVSRDVKILYIDDLRFKKRFMASLSKHRVKIYSLSSAAAFVLLLTGAWNHFSAKKHSLVGEYFSDEKFQDLYKRKNDVQVDFDWKYGPPFVGFKADSFSARWTGFIQAPTTGAYEFITESDDGIVLTINNQKVIDDWNSQSLKRNSATVQLEKGFHPLRLEYFENNAAAAIRLLWKKPSDSVPQIISSKFLRSQSKYLN